MLKSTMPKTDNNIRNPSMNEQKNEHHHVIAQLTRQLQQQQTAIMAIDMGICSLIAAIAETQPTTAAAITMQLNHVRQRLPLHTPQQSHPALNFLEKWQNIAQNNPPPTHHN